MVHTFSKGHQSESERPNWGGDKMVHTFSKGHQSESERPNWEGG